MTRTRALATIAAKLGLLAWSLFPILWMLLGSFRDRSELLSGAAGVHDHGFSIESWRLLLGNPAFAGSMGRSLAAALIATLLTMLLAGGSSYALARFCVPGTSLLRHTSLWAYLFAPVVLAVPIFLILRMVGLRGTLAGLVLAHTAFCFPFGMWLLYPFVRALPVALEEAAEVDGATPLEVLRYIVAPVARPGLTAVAVFCFSLSWSDYLFARVLLDGNNKTLPVFIYDLSTSTVVDWGVLLAAGISGILPVAFAVGVAHRHLSAGIAAAGIKG